jgi:hypothetical protein
MAITEADTAGPRENFSVIFSVFKNITLQILELIRTIHKDPVRTAQ